MCVSAGVERRYGESRAVVSMSMSMTRTCDRPKTGRKGTEVFKHSYYGASTPLTLTRAYVSIRTC